MRSNVHTGDGLLVIDEVQLAPELFLSIKLVVDTDPRLGSRFVAGYVLYTGQQTLPFGNRLRAIPIDALWSAVP